MGNEYFRLPANWATMRLSVLKDECKGCKYEALGNEILCPACSRGKRDNYKPAKVVE